MARGVSWTGVPWMAGVLAGLMAASGVHAQPPGKTNPAMQQKIDALSQAINKPLADDTAVFKTETNGIKLLQTLNPGWPGASPDFAAARDGVQRYKAAYQKFADHEVWRHSASLSIIDKSDLPKVVKDKFPAAYAESYARSQTDGVKRAELTKALTTELDAELAFLQGAKARWSVKDDQIIFTQAEDVTVHRGHMDSLRKINGDMNAMQPG